MSILDTIENNPAAFVGALRAIAIGVIGLLVAFGLPITPDQKTAILDFTGLIVPVSLIFSAITHQTTVPKTPTVDASVKSIQLAPPTVTVVEPPTPPTP